MIKPLLSITTGRRFFRNCSGCHCEERSDEAISVIQWLRLLRFARNDIKRGCFVNRFASFQTMREQLRFSFLFASIYRPRR